MSELVIFLSSPFLWGSCKTCDVCRRLHRVCVCACGGSHVPSPACARPSDTGPVSHPPRPPWLLLCRNTWLHILNSLNAGAEVCRQPTDGTFLKCSCFCKEISIHKPPPPLTKKTTAGYYFQSKKKTKSDSCWVLIHFSVQFRICTNVQFQHFSSAPRLLPRVIYAFCRPCCTCTLLIVFTKMNKWISLKPTNT